MDTDFALISGITIEAPQPFFESELIRTMGYWAYFGALCYKNTVRHYITPFT